MAFTSTRVGTTLMGNKRIAWGTYSSDGGSTGGDINTGLQVCEFLVPVAQGAAATADQAAVNETLPVAGSAVTIVTTANAAGIWWAMGY